MYQEEQEEQKVVKGKNSDIVDFSFDKYNEYTKSYPDKLKDIYAYCRLDCTSLFFSIYVYLESIYTRAVSRAYYVDGVEY